MELQPLISNRIEGRAEVADAWSHLVRLDVAPVGPGLPRLDALIWRVNDLTVGTFSGTAAHMTRTPGLAQDCADDIMLCIERRTRTRVAWNGNREREFKVGDIHIWQADSPMFCETAEAFSARMLTVPRDLLKWLDIDVDPFLRDGGLGAGKPEIRLLSFYLDTVVPALGSLPRHTAERCIAHIKDLVAAALGAPGGKAAHGTGVRAARLKAIKVDIVDNIANPALSLDWLARRHALRPRNIQDLFYAAGEGFTEFVRNTRLDHAHRLLGDPAHDDRNVAEIAFASGFGDISWFTKTFRKRFGMTPSEARLPSTQRPSDNA